MRPFREVGIGGAKMKSIVLAGNRHVAQAAARHETFGGGGGGGNPAQLGGCEESMILPTPYCLYHH